MRQIVERLTCDIGGDMSYGDETTIEQITWNWQGQDYEFDVCQEDRPKSEQMSVHDLLRVSRKFKPSKKQKKPAASVVPPTALVDQKTGVTASGRKSKAVWAKYLDEKTGVFICPVCNEKFNYSQGLGRHAASKHTDYTP